MGLKGGRDRGVWARGGACNLPLQALPVVCRLGLAGAWRCGAVDLPVLAAIREAPPPPPARGALATKPVQPRAVPLVAASKGVKRARAPGGSHSRPRAADWAPFSRPPQAGPPVRPRRLPGRPAHLGARPGRPPGRPPGRAGGAGLRHKPAGPQASRPGPPGCPRPRSGLPRVPAPVARHVRRHGARWPCAPGARTRRHATAPSAAHLSLLHRRGGAKTEPPADWPRTFPLHLPWGARPATPAAAPHARAAPIGPAKKAARGAPQLPTGARTGHRGAMAQRGRKRVASGHFKADVLAMLVSQDPAPLRDSLTPSSDSLL